MSCQSLVNGAFVAQPTPRELRQMVRSEAGNVYQIKQGLLDDSMREQSRQPAISMHPA